MTEQERIDELAAVLDGGGRGDAAASTVALATLAERLGAAVDVPALDDLARARVRERVLAAAPAPGGPADLPGDAGRPDAGRGVRARRAVLALAAALAVLAGSAGALAIAARSAQPGGTLHPVKLATERVELALAGSPLETAQTHLDHAEARLQELEAGVPPDDDDTAATLTRWATSTTTAEELLRSGEVADPVADRVLLAFVGQQRDRLLAVAPELPEELLPTAQGAVELLDGFTTEALDG